MPLPDPTYRGARFFKCDLQTSTPADSGGWLDRDVGADEAGARKFIERCYEVGLEVVAITDHNFASKSFIPLLQKAAKELAQPSLPILHVLPGFELKADVGMGVHVLALFDKTYDLEAIDHCLTSCGVEPPRFIGSDAKPSRKQLADIIRIVQGSASGRVEKGIIILPHLLSNDGLFDRDRIADWLQREEFVNSDLLAIELPKPPNLLKPNFQKLFSNGPDCLEDWRRIRPIACIMSSDAKRLAASPDGNPYLGSRYTWIKMSAPSIEGLRQAFLDPLSRIRLQSLSPDSEYKYPFIRKLVVKNAAFIEDAEFSFSKNLNAFIGGRGSGKSTLLEYIRLVLQGQEVSTGAGSNAVHRAKETVTDRSIISVEIEKEQTTWEFGIIASNNVSILKGAGVDDIKTLFPIEVYSQGELHEMADRPQEQMRVVESVVKGKLNDLYVEREALNKRLQSLTSTLQQRPNMEARRRELQARLQASELRLTNVKPLIPQLEDVTRLRQEYRSIADDRRQEELSAKRVSDAIEELQSMAGNSKEIPLTTLGCRNRHSAHVAQQQKLISAIVKARDEFVEALQAADASVELQQVAEELREKEKQFSANKDALAKLGANPENILRYEEETSDARKQLAQAESELKQLDAVVDERTRLYEEVLQLWEREYQLRLEAIEHLNRNVPAIGEPRKKIVELELGKYADEVSFLEVFKTLRIDGRKISEDELEEFSRSLHARAIGEHSCPNLLLRDWLEKFKNGETPEGSPWGAQDKKAKALSERVTDDALWGMLMRRPRDKVDIKLFRANGELVGRLSGKELSTGQRCTALLTVILAATRNPIIIDQPEDDLDNEFIYSELVPVLRELKEKRQIIVATHNANIPVNGDAENVVSLEVRDGKGRRKLVSGHDDELAVGGMDRLAVQEAVGQVMEGSEEAFRRRKEKYGY